MALRALAEALDAADEQYDGSSASASVSGLSASELRTLRAVMAACCAVSMASCGFILFHHFQFTRRSGGARAATIVPRMVVALSVIDFGFSFPKVFGVPDNAALCKTQAFVLQLAGMFSILWNACIAHCLYRKIVRGDSEALLLKRFKWYLVACGVPSLIGSVVLLSADRFAEADFYCWVSDHKWRFWCMYIFVVLAIIYVSVILLATHGYILRVGSRQRNLDALESSARITLQLRIYILAFVVLWLPSAVFRLLGSFLGPATFPVAILMQVTLCLQGFATGVIYGGLFTKLRRLVCERGRHTVVYKNLSSPSFPTFDTGTGYGLSHNSRHPVSIFVSTFNMGEARLTTSDLEKWIPLGYDIYVIGLQECLHLAEARTLLLRHLMADGVSDTAFRVFDREIGSKNTSLGYHGHIAISVFIKAEDVENGAFYMPPIVRQEINCGKSLVLGRASNKGAVGFAFRYHDTSFAFVSCHLSSDSKGKSKASRRNRDMLDLLKGLHLNLEDVGFEFPHLHHHSFVLGDLNYRLTHRNASVEDVLDLVCKIRASEMAFEVKPTATNCDEDVGKKRWSWSSALKATPTPKESRLTTEFDSCNSLNVSMLEHQSKNHGEADDDEIVVAAHDSRGSNALVEDHYLWDDLLVHDELRNLIKDEQVLFGFQEARIAFPPTFRRTRGAALTRDSTNPWTRGQLGKVYTTEVEGQGFRVPSYTDRILYRSLPDMEHRLHCSLYTSCEEVSISDHKPVVGIFHALVDRDIFPIESETATKKPQRMQDVCGVYECSLHVYFTSITWHESPDVVVMDPGTTEERSSLNFERRSSQALVTVVFPLPSEDIFCAQRKLHELADAMSGGVYLDSSSRSERHLFRSNASHMRWSQFVRDGIMHSTFARPTGNMHVGIKVHAGVGQQAFGQGVICIPQTRCVDAIDACDDELQDVQSFKVELSEGGRHTATLLGSISMQLVQHSDQSVSTTMVV